VARTVQARLDPHAEEDLALLRNEGHNDSDAIRLALREAAERRRRRSALRAEAQLAASDPDDLANASRVRAEMDALAARWPESWRVVRGEVFRLRVPRGTRGNEQRGARFAVVVQADELLALSTVLVAPTSSSAPARSFRPVIEVAGRETRVLAEQTTAVSVDRLGASAGRLTAPELAALDAAMETVLGL
jgi:mRNA interferase MazF